MPTSLANAVISNVFNIAYFFSTFVAFIISNAFNITIFHNLYLFNVGKVIILFEITKLLILKSIN
jgi:hypothetical protein